MSPELSLRTGTPPPLAQLITLEACVHNINKMAEMKVCPAIDASELNHAVNIWNMHVRAPVNMLSVGQWRQLVAASSFLSKTGWLWVFDASPARAWIPRSEYNWAPQDIAPYANRSLEAWSSCYNDTMAYHMAIAAQNMNVKEDQTIGEYVLTQFIQRNLYPNARYSVASYYLFAPIKIVSTPITEEVEMSREDWLQHSTINGIDNP